MRSGLKHFPVMDWGAAGTLGRRFVTGSLGCRRPVLNLAMGWVLSALIICAWQQCQAQITPRFQFPIFSKVQFSALSMIESGDCDSCIGRDGEVSRYQIMPAVWMNQGQFPKIQFSNHPDIAIWVATGIQCERVQKFIATYYRQPTDVEWYLLWHRPARVMSPTTKELDRAQRFANLCERMRHEHD